jgi:hypothetical protein
VKYSRKTEESILAKAQRPSILSKNPSFSVEHVRDTFRFKAVVYTFRDALKFVWLMDKSKDLCPYGLSSKNVAKLDVAKLRTPKEWVTPLLFSHVWPYHTSFLITTVQGWRFFAFDFIMPNHQLVECYIVFNELEYTKKIRDDNATVCPELSNHEVRATCFSKRADTAFLCPDF